MSRWWLGVVAAATCCCPTTTAAEAGTWRPPPPQTTRFGGAALLLNVSSPAACSLAADVCACSALAPGCGWCSSTGTCAPADQCTTTCRECPHTHKTCRSSCRRKCVDTCAAAPSVCGCTELKGCGWCSHSNRCQPYPECSTTCEECDGKCHNFKTCQASCFRRFHPPRRETEGVDADLTWPPSHADTVCAFAIFVATVLASAAGIGGGAVLVPLFTLLGEFTEHEAIPLSIATVFGASMFATLGSYLWQKHPLVPHRPVIAYDAALVLLPATLLGSTVGVFLNKLCPNWLIVALLVLLCAFSGHRTLDKAWKQRAKESASGGKGAYKSLLQAGSAPDEEGTELVAASSLSADAEGAEGAEGAASGGGGASGSDDVSASGDARRALAREVAEESACPYSALLSLLRTWVCCMALSALKGGHGAPSLLGVSCGSPGYWGVVGLNVPVLGLLTWLAGRQLTARHRRRVACGYQYCEGDVQWDGDKVWTYAGYVGVGAIAAGMLGVGGGMILGPIFNELDFHPQVSSATSTIMVFFMASSNVGQFIIFGMLDGQYALFYGIFGGVFGAVIGTKGAKALIDRTGRASFLIFFLAAILLGSGVLMAAAGVPGILKTGFTGFRPICGRTGAAARKGD